MNQSYSRLSACRVLMMAGLMLGFAAEVPADLIRLKHGGELRGKIAVGESRYPNRHRIKMISGATVSVSKNDVEFITRRSVVYEEYEIQSKLTPSDVKSLWSLAQWCQKKRLVLQREKHLRQILELDEDNEQAHLSLGHVKREGKWTTHSEHMLSRGYVRYRGRFITPEEKSLLESSEAERDKEQKWHSKIHLWASWLTGRYNKQRQQAAGHIRTIRDPYAVAALRKFFANESSREIRLLYVESLTNIDSPSSVTALVNQGIFDIDQGVRQRAIDSVPKSKSGQATGVLIGHLNNQKNIIVRRAASALSKLGGESAVPHLIDALVTSHKYRVKVNVPSVGVTLGSGGSVSQGVQQYQLPPEIKAALLTGQLSPQNISVQGAGSRLKKLQTIRVNQQNPEVLEALKSLTKSDFGYDKRTWKLWWLSQNS